LTGECPRTLLLTWRAPDGRFAGAEALRKLAGRMDGRRLRWASLRPCRQESVFKLCEHRAFAPRALHWRLREGALGLWLEDFQAGARARRIAAWTADFRPQVVWVLAEMGAVRVARELRRITGLPLHATMHDAPENARAVLPHAYKGGYLRGLRGLLGEAAGLDCISAELADHLRAKWPELSDTPAVIVPPSAIAPSGAAPSADRALPASGLRRIGVCGSARARAGQWSEFLAGLAGLPFRFEIVAFADEESFPGIRPPPNVTVTRRPYAATESDVIRAFRDEGVCACYLGLGKEPPARVFACTSLSSKLTTYAAAGLPIIVDGPAESVAWRLVRQCEAGILRDDDDEAAVKALQTLFSDRDEWRRMAEGSARLCRQEFDLERNMERFRRLLARTVETGTADERR